MGKGEGDDMNARIQDLPNLHFFNFQNHGVTYIQCNTHATLYQVCTFNYLLLKNSSTADRGGGPTKKNGTRDARTQALERAWPRRLTFTMKPELDFLSLFPPPKKNETSGAGANTRRLSNVWDQKVYHFDPHARSQPS